MLKLKGTASMTKKPIMHLGVISAWMQDPRPALCLWVEGQKQNTGQPVTDDATEATCPVCKAVRAEGMALYQKLAENDKKIANKKRKG